MWADQNLEFLRGCSIRGCPSFAPTCSKVDRVGQVGGVTYRGCTPQSPWHCNSNIVGRRWQWMRV